MGSRHRFGGDAPRPISAGMDPSLRDAGCSLQCKGIGGLHDRSGRYSPPDAGRRAEAALAAVIIAGPEPERDDRRLRLPGPIVCRWLEERFAKTSPPLGRQGIRMTEWGFSTADARTRQIAPEPPAKRTPKAGALLHFAGGCDRARRIGRQRAYTLPGWRTRRQQGPGIACPVVAPGHCPRDARTLCYQSMA